MSRTMQRLSKSTDPQDLHDLLADTAESHAGEEPDDIEPEDAPFDIDMSVAKAKLGRSM